MTRTSSSLRLVGQDGHVVELSAEQVTLGRSVECTESIGHDSISRHHLTIRFDGQHYRAVDQGSTNGTTLNGSPMQPHRPYVLQRNDILKLGDQTSFWVQSHPKPRRVLQPRSERTAVVVEAHGVLAQQPMVSVRLVVASLGAVLVLVGFWLRWYSATSPVAAVWPEIEWITVRLSGLRLLLGYPGWHVLGSPWSFVLPLIAVGLLVLIVLDSRQPDLSRPGWRVARLAGVFLALAYLLVQRFGTQVMWVRTSAAMTLEETAGLESGGGFWLSLLGFVLLMVVHIWFERQSGPRQRVL